MQKNTKIFLSSCMYICILLFSCNASSTRLITYLGNFQTAESLDLVAQLKTDFSNLAKLAPEAQAYRLQPIVSKALNDSTKNKDGYVMEAMFREIAKLAPEAQQQILVNIRETLIRVVIMRDSDVIKAVFGGITQLEPKRQIDVLCPARQIIMIAIENKQIVNMKAVFKKIVQLAPQTQRCVLDTLMYDDHGSGNHNTPVYVQALFSVVAQFRQEEQEYFLNKVNISDFIQSHGNDDNKDEHEYEYEHLKNSFSYCCGLVDVLFKGVAKLEPKMQECALNNLKAFVDVSCSEKKKELIIIYQGIKQLKSRDMQIHALNQIDIEKILINAVCTSDSRFCRGIFISMAQLEPDIRVHILEQINIDNVLMVAVKCNEEACIEAMKDEKTGFALIAQTALYDKIHTLRAELSSAELSSTEQQCAAFAQIINDTLMVAAYCHDYDTVQKTIEGIAQLKKDDEMDKEVLNQVDIYAALKLISNGNDANDGQLRWLIKIINLIKQTDIANEEVVSKALRQIMTPDFLRVHVLRFTDGLQKFNELYKNKNALYYILPELVHTMALMPHDEFNALFKIRTCAYIIKYYGAGPDKNYQKCNLLPIIFDILLQSIDYISTHFYCYRNSEEAIKNIISIIEILDKPEFDQEALNFITNLHIKIVDTNLWFKLPKYIKVYLRAFPEMGYKKLELVKSQQAHVDSSCAVQNKINVIKCNLKLLHQKLHQQIFIVQFIFRDKKTK